MPDTAPLIAVDREFPSPSPAAMPVCGHCGGPVAGAEDHFCCSGCETVFLILKQRGWQDYYRFVDRLGSQLEPIQESGLSFAYLNSASFRREHCESFQGGLRAVFYLRGLSCPACIWLVEKMVRDHGYVRDMNLRFSDGRMTLYFGEQADLQALAEALARLGYELAIAPAASDKSDPALLRLGIAGALAANLMLMSLPFYTGIGADSGAGLFAWLAFLLTLPLLGYCGRSFFTRAWAAFRHGVVDFDLPIALGLSSGFLLSTFHLVRGNYDQLYFDSLGMLVFFLLVGRYLQRRGLTAALSQTDGLVAAMPQMIEVEHQGGWKTVPAEEIVVGTRMRLRPGEVLPVDARLLSERAAFNLQVVSGESDPVICRHEDQLIAGSVTLGTVIEAVATSDFQDSQFARLEELADDLFQQRRDITADRLARRFTALVLILAALGFVLWLPTSIWRAAQVVMTLFIVVCPCALALAKPTARALALKTAADWGIWIKSLSVFDKLPLVRHIVFDKTGVLTSGCPSIVAKKCFFNQPHWLEAAIAELEGAVHHPLGEAFRLRCKTVVGQAREVRVSPGYGVEGVVDGVRLLITGPGGLAHFDIDPSIRGRVAEELACFPATATPVCVFTDGALAALYALNDELRYEVADMLVALKERDCDIALLSGDDPRTIGAIGERLGVATALGAMVPEAKLAYIEAHHPEHTLMVGDGLNDMGALAAAAVSLTHDRGSSSALKFADIILKGSDLSRIPVVFQLVERANLAARRSMLLSLSYNLVAVGLTLAGMIGPLAAAVLMPLSSLSILAQARWTLRTGGGRWVS